MNIKITYNWLLEYLDTDATPQEIAKYLSLSGPSIERIHKIDDDYVFDIEITSNRIDMASVFGIAQEAQAILPQFGKKAQLKFNPLEKYTFQTLQAQPAPGLQLDIEIRDHELCPRFTALVFSKVTIKPAPELIQKRLQMVDIKSINNIIDISNYLMVSLGQPTHMFDYDKIEGHTMILRLSTKGEKVTTLDNKEITLPGGDIVIEDGSGKLIDLCGIMGGLNSSITSETKNVLFFVQTYDKRRIRKTSMLTGQRTMAATYFEKGLDPERVENTLAYGVDMLNKMSDGIANSELFDIYSHKRKEKEVKVYFKDIQRVMGIPIEEEKIVDILSRLGFTTERHEDEELAYPDGVCFFVTVPTYRTDDVEMKEDIIEEVARVYGYYNLPNTISPMVYIKQPKDIELLFSVMLKTKYYLKHIGKHEVLNYSMISGETIKALDLSPSEHLKLSNTISSEIEYMRLSLIPSLLVNMKQNYGKKEEITLFEIAKVYHAITNELPKESYKLGIVSNTSFFDLKGIVESVFREMHINQFSFKKGNNSLFAPNEQATLTDTKTGKEIGTIGKLHSTFKNNLELKEDVFVTEIDFDFITTHYRVVEPYTIPPQNAVIKLDATIKLTNRKTFEEIKSKAFKESKLLFNIEYISLYKDNLTLRFYFTSPERNITEEEANKELRKVLQD